MSSRFASLDSLLRPGSVAVLGASTDPTRIGGRPIQYMLAQGFAGHILPVNPNRAEVQGLRAYARVADLPVEGTLAVSGATVDLAQQLARLSPYGNGNEEPVFVLPRAQVVRADRIGKEGATIRAFVQGEGGGPRLKTLLFRARDGALAEGLLARGAPLHLAGHLRAEEWNGSVTASFFIADAAAA